jgi:hypothetical protein
MMKACMLTCLTAALLAIGPETYAHEVSNDALDVVADGHDLAGTRLGDELSFGLGDSGTAGGRELLHAGHVHKKMKKKKKSKKKKGKKGKKSRKG